MHRPFSARCTTNNLLLSPRCPPGALVLEDKPHLSTVAVKCVTFPLRFLNVSLRDENTRASLMVFFCQVNSCM